MSGDLSVSHGVSAEKVPDRSKQSSADGLLLEPLHHPLWPGKHRCVSGDGAC